MLRLVKEDKQWKDQNTTNITTLLGTLCDAVCRAHSTTTFLLASDGVAESSCAN
jgi:hypothetical protein